MRRRRDWGDLALVLLVVAVFYGVTLKEATSQASDYKVHIGFIRRMLASRSLIIPHPLWHALTLLLRGVLPLSYERCAAMATLASQAALALIVSRWTRNQWLALCLMLCGPILLPAVLDGHLYFGYVGFLTFHNPTVILLKPLALVFLSRSLEAFSEEPGAPRNALRCAALGVATCLAKPSYAICLLPAIVLMALARQLQGGKIDRPFLLKGVLLPLTLTLLWQFSREFPPGGGNGIVFAPLTVLSHYSQHLSAKLFFSILFPLSVLALCFDRAARDIRLCLSWATFLIACFYLYFLAESGPRRWDGNFSWGAHCSLFILFVCSAAFVLEQSARDSRYMSRRLPLFALLGSAHLISGLVFFVSQNGNAGHAHW